MEGLALMANTSITIILWILVMLFTFFIVVSLCFGWYLLLKKMFRWLRTKLHVPKGKKEEKEGGWWND